VKTPFFGLLNTHRARKPGKHADFGGFALYIGATIPYDLVANKLARFCFKNERKDGETAWQQQPPR
jgi:hypothetical protein